MSRSISCSLNAIFPNKERKMFRKQIEVPEDINDDAFLDLVDIIAEFESTLQTAIDTGEMEKFQEYKNGTNLEEKIRKCRDKDPEIGDYIIESLSFYMEEVAGEVRKRQLQALSREFPGLVN